MSTGGKRREQAEQRRNQLVDVALTLFAERGIDAVPVSEIAQAAGVSQGLLYHYFQSKDDLLLAIIERHSPLPTLLELLATPPDRPARETLTELALRIYALLQERRPLMRFVAREVVWRPEMLASALRLREGALTLLAAYLNSRVAAGELRPHDPFVVGQTLASTVLVVSAAGLPADPYLTGAVDVILRGVAVARDDVAPSVPPGGQSRE